MTAALIDASPKRKGSTSSILLGKLRELCPPGIRTEETALHTSDVPAGVKETLQSAGVWVIACPLYVDSVPSHLLSCLMELEPLGPEHPGRTVYAIVNCGFYEGEQAALALKILENWCAKAGFVWGGGLGMGGGGAIPTLTATEKGPMVPICRALAGLGERIARGEGGENQYCTVAFPRFLYRLAGQMGWRQGIRQNGGRAKDLGRQPEGEA